MHNLELDDATWILKEVRAIKRERRLDDTSNFISDPKTKQLELPLKTESKENKEIK